MHVLIGGLWGDRFRRPITAAAVGVQVSDHLGQGDVEFFELFRREQSGGVQGHRMGPGPAQVVGSQTPVEMGRLGQGRHRFGRPLSEASTPKGPLVMLPVSGCGH